MDSRELYKELLEEAHRYGLTVKERRFKSSASGLCKGRIIGVSSQIATDREKAAILAEEMAHCLFTVGDILDTRNILNRLQEEIARRIAERRMEGKSFPLHLAPPGSYGWHIYHQRRSSQAYRIAE